MENRASGNPRQSGAGLLWTLKGSLLSLYEPALYLLSLHNHLPLIGTQTIDEPQISIGASGPTFSQRFITSYKLLVFLL